MTGLNPPSIELPSLSLHLTNTNTNNNNNNTAHQRRGRSGSFLKVEHVDSSNEVALDQAAYANINAEWVNRKGELVPTDPAELVMTSEGAWMIHVVLIATGKVIIDAIPGVTQNLSWTAVNLTYLAVRLHTTSRRRLTPADPAPVYSARISCSIGSRAFPSAASYMGALTTTSRYGSRSTAVRKTHRPESGFSPSPWACAFSIPFCPDTHSRDPQTQIVSCSRRTTRITTPGFSRLISRP
jgi:hypothetical protein